MSSRSDFDSDLEKLTTDATQMANENARLRGTNAQMLAALQYALPVLRDALLAREWTTRLRSASAVADLGPVARDLSPVLVELLRDQEASVRQAAGKALKRVDPEAAARARVR